MSFVRQIIGGDNYINITQAAEFFIRESMKKSRPGETPMIWELGRLPISRCDG